MVSFDHRDPGTPEAEWAAVLDAHPFPAFEAGCRALVVVSAHPDDETLGAGALLAQAHAAGAHVSVIVATDGEQSHPGSASVGAGELGRTRRLELVAAIDELSPGAKLVFLGIPDGAVRENADALAGALAAELAVLDTAAIADVLVVAPWAGDGHGDHRVAGEVAERVATERGARFAGYPIWFWHWATPAELPWGDARFLAVSDSARSAKRRAIQRYRSQVAPLSTEPGDEAVVAPGMLAHFDRSIETFFVPGASEPTTQTLDETFFSEFYGDEDDPWGFETRWYEKRKRAVTVAVLPRERYRSALEVGCSTGALTQLLAERAERILGVDISDKPLRRSRDRLEGSAHASFAHIDVSREWPEGTFDLIVLSEVGYYWDADDLDRAIQHAEKALTPDGHLLACHWRHPVSEYPATGDEVHARLRRSAGFTRLVAHVEEDFILEVFGRSGAVSVARETGLVS